MTKRTQITVCTFRARSLPRLEFIKTNPDYCVYVQMPVCSSLEFVKTNPKLRKLCRFCGRLLGQSLAEPANRQTPVLYRF